MVLKIENLNLKLDICTAVWIKYTKHGIRYGSKTGITYGSKNGIIYGSKDGITYGSKKGTTWF